MNTDTLFKIYQSYTLTKVGELNKHSLVALYAQNEQLSKLNQELTRANRTTEQILRNQIKEIELQEKRRYFKNMTFNLSQAMDLLEKEENSNFRIFASNLFLLPIRDMAKDAIQELEEITDKEYAHNIVKRANSLSDSNKAYISNYQKTPWASFLSVKKQLSDFVLKNKKIIRQLTANIDNAKKNYKEFVEKNNRKKEKAPVKAEDAKKGCVGCSLTIIVIFLLFIIGTYCTQDYSLTKGGVLILIFVCLISGAYYFYGEKKGWDKYIYSKEDNNKTSEEIEKEENDQEENIEALSNELNNLQQEETRLTMQYNDLLQEITADCPKWERKLSEIADYIPHEEKNNENNDPLLFEVAKIIVQKQEASTSLIQRKFAIGYNRASRIMDQLERLGVVGPTNGSQSRVLLCESEEDLSDLFNQ